MPVTVVDIDLSIGGQTEAQEIDAGVLIRRNSDFSKGNESDEDGPLIPDYEMDGVLEEYKFDFEGYETDYTPATLTWNAGVHTELDLLLTFPENLLVWDVTDWDGTQGDMNDIRLIASGEAFSTTNDGLDLMIEGLGRSSAFAGDVISAAFVLPDYQWQKVVEDSVRVTVVDINALVDGNRNGTIGAAEPEDRSLVFWYNSDRDRTYGEDGPAGGRNPFVQADQTAPPPGYDFITGWRDSENSTIDYARDLEDFAGLSLYLDPVLVNNPNVTFDAYVTINNNAMNFDEQIRLNLFATPSGLESDARQHVMNGLIGDSQTSDGTFRMKSATARSDVKNSLNTFGQGTLSGGFNSFLFEAVAPFLNGETNLDMVFPNHEVELVFNVEVNYGGGQSQTLQSKVTLDLHDITEFYDTFVVDHTNGTGQDQRKNVDAVPYAGYSQTTTAEVNGLEGSGFNSDDYIMFVHGWNMTAADKKTFAETSFKRLYWQGYSGRFGTFDWPTFADIEGPRGPEIAIGDGLDVSLLNFTYNASELQAWRSGEALKNVLGNLQQPDPMGKVHLNLMAHSMGNVVAAEAMRLWRLQSTDPLVDTYIAMQGAISAGAFGSDATNALPFGATSDFDLYRYWPVGVGQPAAGGRPYMSDATNTSAAWSQSAATNRVNMFNDEDVALTRAWVGNNTFKPLSGNAAPFEVWPYNYDFGVNGPPSGVYRIDAQTEQAQLISTDLIDVNGRPGTYAYEIMAFASKANSLPIGAQNVQQWFNTNVDIASDIDGLDLNLRGFEPNIRANHSFQFNHDASATWNFWDRVKEEIGFSSTYDMTGSGGLSILADNIITTNALTVETPTTRATQQLSLMTMDPVRHRTLPSVFGRFKSVQLSPTASPSLELLLSHQNQNAASSRVFDDAAIVDTVFAELSSKDATRIRFGMIDQQFRPDDSCWLVNDLLG